MKRFSGMGADSMDKEKDGRILHGEFEGIHKPFAMEEYRSAFIGSVMPVQTDG